MDMYPPVVKKRSFLGTLFCCVACIVVVGILSGAAVVLYGMNIADRKSDTLLGVITQGVEALPELVESLPPFFADLVNDERRLDYADQLDVSVRLVGEPANAAERFPVVEVRNRGAEVVSLLSMRIVLLDNQGNAIAEVNEWAATPVAVDHDWRGPLMPGATRRFPASRHFCRFGAAIEGTSVEAEITDVRIWRGHAAEKDTGNARAPIAATRPAGDA
ncbi:MAG: hypothetical protein JXA69_03965 [Phycisphaerae bacterium]|nr:hypothetical protein [Phycisphaerae bacterium]